LKPSNFKACEISYVSEVNMCYVTYFRAFLIYYLQLLISLIPRFVMKTLISKVIDYDNRVQCIIVVSESHCLLTLCC